MPPRKIIHVDMDAFYASVEQRDQPELRGKPLAVGGQPTRRGVVAAASYEARAFGVYSAMPMATAVRLCPSLVIVPPDFARYKAASNAVFSIFREVTPLVEPLSLDEAYLDVTTNLKNIALATQIAREIRAQILERTQLTASAGISYNKFLAKLASDYRKPNGQFVIPPGAGEALAREREDLLLVLGIGAVGEALLPPGRVPLPELVVHNRAQRVMPSSGARKRPV